MIRRAALLNVVLSCLAAQLAVWRPAEAGEGPSNPYAAQVAEQLALLNAPDANVRAAAAEALGYLRDYGAADALVRTLAGDSEAAVRREAAMSLGWCGGRPHVAALLNALDDPDWTVRQAARAALANVTGMDFPFDGLAEEAARRGQADVWRRWWASAPPDAVPPEVLALVAEADLEAKLRGVRALGSLGGVGAARLARDALDSLLTRAYDELDPTEKHVGQAAVRALGRLRDPAAFETLLRLLENPGWARYAADALADYGDPQAARPLIAVYPRYSRRLDERTRDPELCPDDDRFSGDNTQDRMHETPYQIALALTRLPLREPAVRRELRRITPYLLANFPSNWDFGVFYELEATDRVTAHLLDQAGVRDLVRDCIFEAAARWDDWFLQPAEPAAEPGLSLKQRVLRLAMKTRGDTPYMGNWIPAFCTPEDIPRLIGLLEHQSGWLRINAAKALMLLGAREAVPSLARMLAEAPPDALYGFSGVLEHAEYNSPAPRWREAFIRALGRLGAGEHARLLIGIMNDKRNVVDVQYAAALALDELGSPEALAALRRAEAHHPFYSVRLAAREALWRRGWDREPLGPPPPPPPPPAGPDPPAPAWPEAIVFIKGENRMRSDYNGQAGVDPWRQTYTITNSGPTWRVGRNLYILRPARPGGEVIQLTHFTDGLVADCEVSWDGKKIIFSRRLNGDLRNYSEVPYHPPALRSAPALGPPEAGGADDPGGRGAASGPRQAAEPPWGGPDDPWWHIWEINVDGTGLRQLTFGPYHDVHPAYLPDGRIVFSSSRLGLRDEYHGFPAIGLTVMNPDGTDIHPIGFNLGGDREPAVLADGRLIFSRLDNFYSRLKTEVTLQTAFPDGTKNVAFYGPERRAFWRQVHRRDAAWTMRPAYGGVDDNRNRVLRLSQPQPLGRDRVIFASSGGLAVAGPGRFQERRVPHPRKYAVTTPFPVDERRVLCAATVKQFLVDGVLITGGTPEFEKLPKGPELFRSAVNIDLGLYVADVETGDLELLYNDPATAEFEPRPIMPRPRPPVLSDSPEARSRAYTARLQCNSALLSRERRTTTRGVFVRVIEGMPVVARHETQANHPTNRWKNHGGTFARVLGTVPLAADGSFFIEAPADRLLHLQVLDSDRRVVNNQIFWLYARPGETRSCVGCHEDPNIRPPSRPYPLAAAADPVPALPFGGEFTYRAKAWLKGFLPDECEERQRTVRAVSLLGRY